MRALTSSTGSFFRDSVALRPGSGVDGQGREHTVSVDEIAELPTPSGALYFGPISGENGHDGVVIKAPVNAVQVVATRGRSASGVHLLALTFTLGTSEITTSERGALQPEDAWTPLPGQIPVISGGPLQVSRGPLVVCDAGLRDMHRDGTFPWDQWVRDEALSQLEQTVHPEGGCAAAMFPGRSDYLITLMDSVEAESKYALFVDRGADGAPLAIHLAKVEPSSPNEDPAPQSAFGSFAGDNGLHRALTNEAPRVDTAATLPPTPVASSDRGMASPLLAPVSSLSDDGRAASCSPATETGIRSETNTHGSHPRVDELPAVLREAYGLLDAGKSSEALTRLHLVLRSLDDEPPTQALTLALAEREFTPATLADLVCDIELELGEDDHARRTLRRALAVPSLNDSPLEAVHLAKRLGELELQADHLPQAIAALELGRGTAESFLAESSRRSQHSAEDLEALEFASHYDAHISFLLADARVRGGSYALAAELASQAVTRFTELERDAFGGRAALVLANAHRGTGNDAARRQALAEAERLFRRGHRKDGLGITLGYLALDDAKNADFRSAIAKLIEARDELESVGLFADAAIASEDLAVCFERVGEQHAAQEARRAATLLSDRGTRDHSPHAI